MANLTLAAWKEIEMISGVEAIPDGQLGIYVKAETGNFAIRHTIDQQAGISILHFTLHAKEKLEPKPIKLVWKIPAINLRGTWTSNYDHTKRIYAEWESTIVKSRVAYETPVVGLYSHEDDNIHTFACSDALNLVQMGAGLREESSWVYCSIELFTERMAMMRDFEFSIRLDSRKIRYEEALKELGEWWAGPMGYLPIAAPDIARMPMYSTWYNYHQEIEESTLLAECKKAVSLGYRTIIVDDGWQTKDNKRGYAFTGDWQADRFADMKKFVENVHALDMKVILWYSVPFFGKESAAYQQFKGKFLRYSEEWNAAILDPRYPEVRAYIVSVYTKALKNWNLDGFKLDFIDHILSYPDTQLSQEEGRDYASVNAGVHRLMTDVRKALVALKPDIMIEFRQHYISPLMRTFGNIFRAHDCPNDAITNRVRTTDLRLLSGDTVIHSDMFMWHYSEPVHLAALQFLNILFSVPQLSVRLEEIPADHHQMIKFYTNYWIENRKILLDAPLEAKLPLESYPQLTGKGKNKTIIALYLDLVIVLKDDLPLALDIVNAKTSDSIILDVEKLDGKYTYQTFNCLGKQVQKGELQLAAGLIKLNIPPSGLIQLKAIDQ